MSDMPRLTRADLDASLDREISRIPAHCREGLIDYLRYGQPPGHFLLAVLSNDLAEACKRADEENRYALFDYVYLLTNWAPSGAWGSPQHVKDWIAKGMALRREQFAQAEDSER
jgi:hypothetical protein